MLNRESSTFLRYNTEVCKTVSPQIKNIQSLQPFTKRIYIEIKEYEY